MAKVNYTNTLLYANNGANQGGLTPRNPVLDFFGILPLGNSTNTSQPLTQNYLPGVTAANYSSSLPPLPGMDLFMKQQPTTPITNRPNSPRFKILINCPGVYTPGPRCATASRGSTSAQSSGSSAANGNTEVSALNQQMSDKAHSYVGRVNSSAEGNRLFSPAGYQNTEWYRRYGRWGWCCDFAVHCAKDTLGSKYPRDMITSSPQGLATAAERHNAYLRVPSSDKASWLTTNVKPGDIIYMKGSGDSGKHIAVVNSVDADGTIHATSGNSGGKVKEVTYNINKNEIYGFVSLSRLAA
ncbi:MAG: CHAP domain-containing protein [Cyanobacteria bacterium RUI128]|nr:CHAP domain-containing protein [Cyanobacteria bacterium RUI128]